MVCDGRHPHRPLFLGHLLQIEIELSCGVDALHQLGALQRELLLGPVVVDLTAGILGGAILYQFLDLIQVREPDLPPQAIGYTRRVTQVWCGFFAINGAIAVITALWASSATWSLYNGLIAYLLMGLLFAGEYLTRWHFKARRHV